MTKKQLVYVPVTQIFPTGMPVMASGRVDWKAVEHKLEDWQKAQPFWGDMRPSEKAMTIAAWLPAAVRHLKSVVRNRRRMGLPDWDPTVEAHNGNA